VRGRGLITPSYSITDDFVAADLQIRPSCATILSDVHPPIIVLKKLPVTDGNLCAINQAIDAISGFARAVSLLACERSTAFYSR
jgi:hypothetical protein